MVCKGCWSIYRCEQSRLFISVSLFQRSSLFICFALLLTSFFPYIFLCVRSFLFGLILFTDVFNSPMWAGLKAAIPEGDRSLSLLAESLPDVVLAGRAPNTSSKYGSAYGRWKSWASRHKLQVFPASPFHVALYLRFLMLDAKTAAPLQATIHSLSSIHQLAGEQSPTDHPLVKDILDGAQRLLAHHKTKKGPITVSQLQTLVAYRAGPSASLYDIRSASLFCWHLLPFFVLMS